MAKDSAVTLRPATMADARLLHAWRNDPETRRGSRNTGIVPWADHEVWLTGVLASPDRVLRVAEENGKPVGVVRADHSIDGWELSWAVAPRARGRGIGREMLKIFTAGIDGRVFAVIRRDNAASAKIAATAGLVRGGATDDPDFDRWIRD